jgi:hypothetical protein
LCCALILVIVLVWWGLFYSPLQDERGNLEVAVLKVSQKNVRLEQRWKKLSKMQPDPRKAQKTQIGIPRLLVPGNNLKEVSVHTQEWFQEFLRSYDLSLKSYKELPPSMWGRYPLSRVQFQLDTNIRGLSDLLEDLENMELAVRIEDLSVSYRRNKEKDLRVSLNLGTLFVEGLKE